MEKPPGEPLITFDTAFFSIGSDGPVISHAVGAHLYVEDNKSKGYGGRLLSKMLLGKRFTGDHRVRRVRHQRGGDCKVSNPHWDYVPGPTRTSRMPRPN